MVTRILHIITTIDRGGAENQLLALAKAQVRGGDVVLVGAIKGNNELKEDFKKSGIGVFSTTTGKNLIKQMLKIYQEIKEFGPDVVHAHLPRAELMIACLPIRVPLVVSRHNSENFFPNAPQFISRLFSRYVGFRANRIIFISQHAKEYSLASREILASKKVALVYYGIESNIVLKQKRKTDRFTDFAFKFITVSRLVEQKDLETQIRGVNRLRNQNVVLEIIGEGELLGQLESLVNDLHLNEKVKFLRRTAHVMEALANADCFILSSKYEGFGLVILEAILSGIPIIASDIPTTREILGNDYRLLFKVGDDEKLAELMQKVMVTEVLYDEKYEAILNQFSIDKTQKEIDEVYCQILGLVKNE